jgi:hypothetical protein
MTGQGMPVGRGGEPSVSPANRTWPIDRRQESVDHERNDWAPSAELC